MEGVVRTQEHINEFGCAYGKVTRERVGNTADDILEIRRDIRNVRGRVDALIMLGLGQLLAFVAAAFWFVATRAVP